MEIATTCCRYLIIVFRPDFPPADANGEFTKVEMIVRHLSEKSLLMYALEKFQVHLNHLGSSDEKIRDEFMDFVELLKKWNNSYAHLLLGQWIEALKWPTNLHVYDTTSRLCLHVLLLCAADIRKEGVAQVLVSLRPDLLHIEAGKGNLVTTERLHENPPHPISQIIGGFPIRGAHEQRNGLMLLVDLEIDADLKDTAGRTPMSYAAEKGYESSIRLLIQQGANVESRDSAGRTPLSYAAENGQDLSIRRLLKNGADEESEDNTGRTPLFYAAGSGQEPSLLPLDNGRNIELEDWTGRTPLSYAAENGEELRLRRLLESGADIESEDKTGRTPLSYAAENGQEPSLRQLIEKGANDDSKDRTGRTPLSYAAENGHEGSVKLLLGRGDVKLNLEDMTGQTPLSYAVGNGHIAVVKLLKSHIET